MTIIVDGKGTRWVDIPQKKRRTSPRALRFAELKVGNQLMRRWPCLTVPGDSTVVWYYLVTDLWFDPVAGQKDETAGRMAAIQAIGPYTSGRKEAHTLRGLASQGFRYADVDYVALKTATQQARQEGAVVGIGHAHVIRRRPKVAGKPL